MTDPTPTRDEAVLPSEITEAQINSACLSYRHDFGLLNDHDKERLRFVAKEWLHAWRKEFDPLAPALKVSAPAPASGGVDAVAEAKFDDWTLKAKLTLALRTLRIVEHYLPAIETHHSPASGLTGRQAAERVLVTISELSHASLSPAATPVSEAEPVAWRYRVKRWHDGKPGPWKLSDEPDTPSLWTRDAGYEVEALLAKPATSPAGGDVVETLDEADPSGRIAAAIERAAQEGYRVCAETRHVTLGDKVRWAILALSQSTSAGRVGE